MIPLPKFHPSKKSSHSSRKPPKPSPWLLPSVPSSSLSPISSHRLSRPGSIHCLPGVGRYVSMPSSSPGHSWSSGEIVQGHPRRSVGNLITFTGISTAFNIAHSSTGFLYQASHAFLPISLCVSVKLLMSIIWSDLTAGVTSPVTASPQLADKEDRGSQIRRAAADITRSFGGNVADKNAACMFIIISREQLKKRIVFDRKLNALKKE